MIEKIDFSANSNIVIGHTRCATRGKVGQNNVHPHKIGKFIIVHNGIIENYNSIKKDIRSKAYEFKSDTDTEVLCFFTRLYICIR